MDHAAVEELVNYVTAMMKAEQEALLADHPDSTCAARHKGEIAAYGRILAKISKLMQE